MRVLSWILAAVFAMASTEAMACQQYYDVTGPKAIVIPPVGQSEDIVLTDVSISVYIAGTGTLATIYSDQTCATSIPNPTSSVGDGSFSFYAKDGRYDLKFAKTGYVFTDLTSIAIYEPLGENTKTIADYRTVDVCATGTGAIDQIGAAQTTLVINQPSVCTLDKTAPSTLHWKFVGAGSVTISATKTLTVNGPVTVPHGLTAWKGTGAYVFGSGAGPYPYGQVGTYQLTYGATVTPDTRLGRMLEIVATNATAFTVAAPTDYGAGREFALVVKNTSGGALGTITWNSVYKMATWTSPANGFQRAIWFRCDGTKCYETTRTTADIPN